MHQSLLLAAAAVRHADPPILDLDSTVFVQLAIFIVTAIILSRFLFKPYLAVKDARTAGMEGAKDEAVKMEADAEKRMADYQAAVNAAKTQANAERAKLQSDAVSRERNILEAARKSTQSTIDAARQKIGKDAATARAQLGPRAVELAREMATKILGREVA